MVVPHIPCTHLLVPLLPVPYTITPSTRRKDAVWSNRTGGVSQREGRNDCSGTNTDPEKSVRRNGRVTPLHVYKYAGSARHVKVRGTVPDDSGPSVLHCPLDDPERGGSVPGVSPRERTTGLTTSHSYTPDYAGVDVT